MATNNCTNTSKPVAIAQGGTGSSSMATTDGTIYYNGTSFVTTATGTSGYVLTSNGSGNAPTYQASSVSSGNLVLIQSQTSSGASSIQFTSGITATYNTYYITWRTVIAASGSTNGLECNITTSGSFPGVTSGFLSGAWTTAYNSSTITNTNSTSTIVCSPVVTSVTGVYYSGYMLCFNVTSGKNFGCVGSGVTPATSSTVSYTSFSSYNSGTTAINGFEFIVTSGNIAGTFNLYGVLE
jgi:hypothetical protein